ncbi:hypothetical protein CBS101457_001984 [Exobasidium rhododendri]|nr:hypothetical protein CBS101457_001984 [Exobasidium rhododendri]
MATPTRKSSNLPFGLQYHNAVYMGLLSAIVLFGTVYSMIYSTHTYNVMLSNSVSHAATAPKAASSATLTSSSPRLDSMIDSARLPATIFADRRNLLNKVFIKYAWAWTTLAFLAQAFTLRSSAGIDVDRKEDDRKGKAKENREDAIDSSSSPSGTGETKEATVYSAMSTSTLRYLVATVLWLFFASWFFGPPLMDRIRHYTGAQCLPSTSTFGGISLPGSVDPHFCYAKKSLTPQSFPRLFQTGHQIVAAAHGGSLKARWRGGHDISGHTYILVLSSLYLLEEVTPFLPYLFPSSVQPYVQRVIPRQYWSPFNPFIQTSRQSRQKARANLLVAVYILGLVGVWCSSLLFTSLFFHTPQEKISGLLVALGASLLIPKHG